MTIQEKARQAADKARVDWYALPKAHLPSYEDFMADAVAVATMRELKAMFEKVAFGEEMHVLLAELAAFAPAPVAPPAPYVAVRLSQCRADCDGDCTWAECPQKANRQTVCPLSQVPVAPPAQEPLCRCGHAKVHHIPECQCGCSDYAPAQEPETPLTGWLGKQLDRAKHDLCPTCHGRGLRPAAPSPSDVEQWIEQATRTTYGDKTLRLQVEKAATLLSEQAAEIKRLKADIESLTQAGQP